MNSVYKERTRVAIVVRVTAMTLILACLAPQSPAAPAEALSTAASATNLQSELGTGFTYQGRLDQNGSLVNDACEMAFRLYDQATSGAQVGSAITATVPITDGLFTITLDFGAGAFNGDRRWLGIAVDCEEDGTYADLGRQELTATPYALYAARSGRPENVITVAQGGGDYTSVQAAIDSISDAAGDNAYLVWVAPGVYEGQVRMKPYVHLQGAGQDATIITSDATSSSSIPDQATLVLTRTTSLRNLTVVNDGAGLRNVALLATAGTGRPLVADVTARTRGSGTYNFAIFLYGGKMAITLQRVTALAENGSSTNCGLFNAGGAGTTLRGGSFTAREGVGTCGICTADSGTALDAEGVSALGQYGSVSNYGLYNYTGAAATLRGGSFTAYGGTDARGIYNQSSGTTLDAEGVTALGENGSDDNYGLYNGSGAEATLHDGSFNAHGGGDARGISNSDSGTTLEATGVTALAEDGSGTNSGLGNDSGAVATLHGGSFTARAGAAARGVSSSGSGATLEATGVTALAEDGSGNNSGLHNDGGAVATLHGGSFTARGGINALGISNCDSGTTLQATGVTALAENGTSFSDGLYNCSSAIAEVDSSRLTGISYSLYSGTGTVYLGVTQLDGATSVGGTLTCFQVYDGNYASHSCNP